MSTTFDLPNGMRVIRQDFEAAGTSTWTLPTPPTGYVLAFHDVQVFNGGRGGGKPASGSAYDLPGGLNGGSNRVRLSPGDVGASQTVTVGAGGAGATSTGSGSDGGLSSFGTLVTCVRGLGILRSDFAPDVSIPAPLSDASRPGNGGTGGAYDLSSAGGDGGSSAGATGGTGGTFVSTGGSTPTAGANGGPSGLLAYGGAGGGGGGAAGGFTPKAGAAGGKPGGGGGSGGSAQSLAANGAAGGDGAVYVWSYYVYVPVGSL